MTLSCSLKFLESEIGVFRVAPRYGFPAIPSFELCVYVFACDMIQYRTPTFQFRNSGKHPQPQPPYQAKLGLIGNLVRAKGYAELPAHPRATI